MLTRLNKVKVFRALGDEKRLEIVRRLRDAGGELPCSAVVEASGATRPGCSYHYKELEQAGIIRRRREGQTVTIVLNKDLLVEECPGLLESL